MLLVSKRIIVNVLLERCVAGELNVLMSSCTADFKGNAPKTSVAK
jgi:hypothetical protein